MKDFNKHSTLVTVYKRATEEVGTTANLQEGHTLSVWDLLHGLMLPSGNDAALVLANYFGEYLLDKDQKQNDQYLNCNITVKDTMINAISNKDKTRSSSFFPEIRHGKELNSDYSFVEDKQSSILYNATSEKIKSYSINRDVKSRSFSDKFPKVPKIKTLFYNSPKILRFIKEMNKYAKKLGMFNTHFDSPHGLINNYNKSTAYDIALL